MTTVDLQRNKSDTFYYGVSKKNWDWERPPVWVSTFNASNKCSRPTSTQISKLAETTTLTQ